MIVSLIAPLKEISGKQADPVTSEGLVYMPAAGRTLARQMVVPANPNTSRQQAIRTIQTLTSAAMKLVTESEREAWGTLATNFTRTGRLGQSYTLNWSQCYAMVNNYRLMNGQAITDTAPALSVPATPDSIAALQATDTEVSFDLSYTTGAAFYLIEVSRPLLSLSRQARDNEFVTPSADFADSIITATTSPQSIAIDYSGLPDLSGQRIGWRITPLSASYIPGPPLLDRNAACAAG